MKMPSDEHQAFVRDEIDVCRREVDKELHEIRMRFETHFLTEDQAEDIATRAAQKAKSMTKKELIDDAKMEIADAAIGIMRRAIQALALFIVGLSFYVGAVKWPWK